MPPQRRCATAVPSSSKPVAERIDWHPAKARSGTVLDAADDGTEMDDATGDQRHAAPGIDLSAATVGQVDLPTLGRGVEHAPGVLTRGVLHNSSDCGAEIVGT